MSSVQDDLHRIAGLLDDGRITSEIPPATFQGKLLRYKPKNVGTLTVARRFHSSRSSFVRLEPGDTTRYDLLITPLDQEQFKPLAFSYGLQPLASWGHVAILNLGKKVNTFVEMNNFFSANLYNEELLHENPHTLLAVCWYIGWLSFHLQDQKYFMQEP